MATVEQTMMKVQRILTGPMGLSVQLRGDTLAVAFQDVSTQINIHVAEWGQNDEGETRTLVRLSAPLLWSVEPGLPVYEWIAREGGNYFFGHVAAFDDETDPGRLFLVMTHTLLGDYLDQEELAAALWAMLGTADTLDDELQQRFGGKRLADQTA